GVGQDTRTELNGTPSLILPYGCRYIAEEIIEKHRNWLEKKIKFVEEIKRKYEKHKVYNRTDDELKKIIKHLLKRYSKILDLSVEKTTFRHMKSKWASCRKNGRLSFNLKMKYLPMHLIRYIVFHEMVHLIVPDHKADFWAYVKKEFKNPEKCEEALYGYWFLCLNNRNSIFQ
ncbi:MAG TPA: M48 family metallopeptidase, partial [bacterium]|nr:M48 family metallopeptidase [bacterium]